MLYLFWIFHFFTCIDLFFQLIDLATIDIIRDRERGVPRYNQFRRLLNLTTPDTFEKLTNDTVTAAELKQAYNGNIEDVDLLIGSLAEARPDGFGFGDTPFHLFLCMANRRLRTDRCAVVLNILDVPVDISYFNKINKYDLWFATIMLYYLADRRE